MLGKKPRKPNRSYKLVPQRNILAKKYEMSDKTSLFSYEESNTSNTSIENPNLTKINTQIQNKFNINVISPNMNANSINNNLGALNNSMSTLSNSTNNVFVQKRMKNMDSSFINKMMNPNLNNKNSVIPPPRVMMECEVSSNSDVDNLLVAKATDRCRSGFQKSNSPNSRSIQNGQSTSNSCERTTIPVIVPIKQQPSKNNTNTNNSFKNLQTEVQSTPPSKTKPRQVFFPCEIPVAQTQMQTQTEQNQNQNHNIKQTNILLQTPQTRGSNIFDFQYVNPYTNPFPYFSETNTPMSDQGFFNPNSNFKHPMQNKSDSNITNMTNMPNMNTNNTHTNSNNVNKSKQQFVFPK